MITMRPTFGIFPPAAKARKPKLRRFDEMVIFPLLLIVVVLIGILLMMLIEICRYPRWPAAGNPQKQKQEK